MFSYLIISIFGLFIIISDLSNSGAFAAIYSFLLIALAAIIISILFLTQWIFSIYHGYRIYSKGEKMWWKSKKTRSKGKNKFHTSASPNNKDLFNDEEIVFVHTAHENYHEVDQIVKAL